MRYEKAIVRTKKKRKEKKRKRDGCHEVEMVGAAAFLSLRETRLEMPACFTEL